MFEIIPNCLVFNCTLESVVKLILADCLEVIGCQAEEVEHVKRTNEGCKGTFDIGESRVYFVSWTLCNNCVLISPAEVFELGTCSNRSF